MPNHPSFKDMPLWQRSVQLAVELCQLSLELPNSQKLILVTTLQETALAIPVTLARGSKAGKQGFLAALGSARQTAAELETVIIIMQNIYKHEGLAVLHNKTMELQVALGHMAQRLTTDRPNREV